MAKHAMPKHKNRKAAVRSDLSRLGGRSEARLERDDKRGPASPLGIGTKKKGAGR
jgi:hypothetical protein